MSILVRKLQLVRPIKGSKFVVLAQGWQPLSGALYRTVVLGGEQIPILMPSSPLWVFVVVHPPPPQH
jgi:hypothetical protein